MHTYTGVPASTGIVVQAGGAVVYLHFPSPPSQKYRL